MQIQTCEILHCIICPEYSAGLFRTTSTKMIQQNEIARLNFQIALIAQVPGLTGKTIHKMNIIRN